MDVRFVIVAPPKSRKSFKVRLPVVVGRGDEAKVRIQQDSVSRRHCEFALDGDMVTVTDLGSTNGTLVAGARIEAHAATAVPSGAEVRIGGIVLRVEYAESDGAPTAAPAAAAPHVGDTVPLPAVASPPTDSADALPELEPLAETLPELEPIAGAAAAPPDGPPTFPDVEAASAPVAAPAFPDVASAPPPAEGSFDFLGGDPAPPPESDDKLDDFFKSLS